MQRLFDYCISITVLLCFSFVMILEHKYWLMSWLQTKLSFSSTTAALIIHWVPFGLAIGIIITCSYSIRYIWTKLLFPSKKREKAE